MCWSDVGGPCLEHHCIVLDGERGVCALSHLTLI